jgi:hypothetical protein
MPFDSGPHRLLALYASAGLLAFVISGCGESPQPKESNAAGKTLQQPTNSIPEKKDWREDARMESKRKEIMARKGALSRESAAAQEEIQKHLQAAEAALKAAGNAEPTHEDLLKELGDKKKYPGWQPAIDKMRAVGAKVKAAEAEMALEVRRAMSEAGAVVKMPQPAKKAEPRAKQ